MANLFSTETTSPQIGGPWSKPTKWITNYVWAKNMMNNGTHHAIQAA